MWRVFDSHTYQILQPFRIYNLHCRCTAPSSAVRANFAYLDTRLEVSCELNPLYGPTSLPVFSGLDSRNTLQFTGGTNNACYFGPYIGLPFRDCPKVFFYYSSNNTAK